MKNIIGTAKKRTLSFLKHHLAFRKITAPLRVLPDFLIIGGQKCGTTSLYHYLVNTPCVIPAGRKALHFFDTNNKYFKGINLYKSNFSTTLYRRYLKSKYNQDFATGEASAYYLFHPHAPRRIFEVMPNVKFVILLRNPIDRAYSHYRHMVKWKIEMLSFEESLEKEADRLSGELDRMVSDETYESYDYNVFSYLQRGIYINQIYRWRKLFRQDQFLILKSEDFFNDPVANVRSVLSFLNLPKCADFEFKIHNEGDYANDIKLETREYLFEFFQQYNQKLYDYIGTDFGWK